MKTDSIDFDCHCPIYYTLEETKSCVSETICSTLSSHIALKGNFEILKL